MISNWHQTSLLTWKLSVGNWWRGTDVTHVWSHTVSTATYTNPFITHRQCEARARAGLSFDVSATLLAVCLTLLPFRGKTLWNTLCELLTMFCVWVLMYKAAGSGLLQRYFFTNIGGYCVLYGLSKQPVRFWSKYNCQRVPECAITLKGPLR